MPWRGFGYPAFSARRLLILGFALFAVLMVVVSVDAARRVLDARRSLIAARADFLVVHDTLRPLVRFDIAAWPDGDAFERARQGTVSARAHVLSARARLGYVEGLAGRSGWVPVLGPDLARVPELLAVTGEATVLAGELLTVVSPLFEGNGTIVELSRQVFVERSSALSAGLSRLDALRPRISALASVEWHGPFEPVGGMLSTLEGDLELTPTGIEIARQLGQALDPLLGFGGAATYVILGQNDHEIRPTGGYIGTAGIVTVSDGEVIASAYRSSTEFDPNPLPERAPPEPMMRYLGSSIWFLREANWWPDFPSTARQVLEFLSVDQGTFADGVIAVDSEIVGLLLRALGPISVAEFDVPLTADNWFEHLEQALFDAEHANPAKETYLQPVLEQLLSRAQLASRDQIAGLLRALQQGARGRHIQAYSRHRAVQSLFDALGVSGAMQAEANEDFVAVIDANFSFDKIQPAIHREATYIRAADGSVELKLTWRNEVSTYKGTRYARFGAGGAIYNFQLGRVDRVPGVFGNFTRIYLPGGARLLAVSGFDGAPRYEIENGFSVVSGFVVIEDGAERTVEVRYRSPDAETQRGVRFWKQGDFPAGAVEVLQDQDGDRLQLFRGAFEQDIYVPFR